MRILYAIQGTGNGHIARARDIVPILSAKGELDVLVSGTQADLSLPFDVKYRLNGLSFIFGKKGGVDLLETYRKTRLRRLFSEVKTLPVNDYDVVISDFEPVSAWACLLNNKPCIGLSHQAAVLNKQCPAAASKDPVGKAILRYYAPCSVHYGFHFKPYAEDIFTPVIRSEIRNIHASDAGHYTVYLPAYSDKSIINILSEFPYVQWHVFSKHFEEVCEYENILLSPVNNEAFINSLASCTGVICGAGFETPAEALFLQKKLLVVPMKNQYEQQCNAAALRDLGVPVIKSFKRKHIAAISDWLDTQQEIRIDYPDNASAVIDHVLEVWMADAEFHTGDIPEKIKFKEFRKLALKNILYKLSN